MVNSLLNNAVTGLLSSQRSAEEAAQRILNATTARSGISSGVEGLPLDSLSQTTSPGPSFDASLRGNNGPIEQDNASSNNSTGRPALTPLPAEILSLGEESSLVQNIVDLKASQSAFRASAAVFRRINEVDESLQETLNRD